MGLTIDYLWSLSFREFQNIATGYNAKEDEKYKLSWEQTRSIMYMVNISIPRKKPVKETIQSFLPFDWDITLRNKKIVGKNKNGKNGFESVLDSINKIEKPFEK